jgi:hypothetical protein
MNAFLERPSVSAIRRIARILVTVISLFALGEFVEGITYRASNKLGPTIPDYLGVAVFLLLFAGCGVGWFRDLPAAVLLLGASLLSFMTALAFPGEVPPPYFSVIPAIPGLIFLYVHFAGKKK